MTFEDILQNLKKKIYHPVYFLMGEEPYFIDRITDYIAQNVLTEAEKGFNQTVLYGKDTEPDTIITHARRFPMMSNHQVVIVKEAQNIKKIEDLEPYMKNPLQSTILVINYKYKSIDKRKTFAKLIDKNGVLFEANRIYDNQLPAWINTYLATHKYTISPQASAMMAEYLGADLGKVSNELDKLIISLPENTQITPDHIERNIGISKEYNVFELQNALGEKNVLKANRIINYFGANPGSNPITRVISSLYYYFEKLLVYQFLEDKSKNAVASKLGINPYFVQSYVTAAKNYSIKKLVEIIAILREYDMKSKGVGNVSSDPGDLQREMIYKILH
ncbi:MAG: DNA polymerase III subunit delta [Bacteroidetes bacterium GWF2_42_66]|nr:MAG: DNA polymerase III subunit delta [Bacteroidetes bacterium GWA2_42_15]OFX99955.1 MAG: DNA polymerase III subunit delta [Bacteroidetes bacterium GWE2_42_39]OFY40140.1 MAG: DNA polymerase III subunit delta [Bacteroidetes bacterium GWF2_42_66]HBL73965.1 DNA polymerase III subunit delta [Prolixibacteraceae bacterium]HCR89225.1 DNA polymerase III subunit delta [Prolixibacteraceae bacterium]